MVFKYLSVEHIAGFDKYKYSSVDTSPVSKYISHPYWNFVVQFYPRWLAPNVLTLVGFLLVVLNYTALSYYDYDFLASDDTRPASAPVPRWAWLVLAVSSFTAHTLDGTDGKQARRTGSCGPLGELFDHGLDSWASMLMMCAVFSLPGLSQFTPFRLYFVLLGVLATFGVTHWEKYLSHVLYLPWGYDISQYTMALCFLSFGTFGHGIWKFDVPILGWSFGHVFEAYIYATIILMAFPISAWNIYIAHREGRARTGGVWEATRPLIPFFLLFVLFLAWAVNSSVDIMTADLRLMMFATGTVFSNITCRLIVCGMSNTRAEASNWLLVPLAGVAAAVSVARLGRWEVYLLWAYTLLSVVAHLHYGICVVCQLAEHLNIYVFTIGKRRTKRTMTTTAVTKTITKTVKKTTNSHH